MFELDKKRKNQLLELGADAVHISSNVMADTLEAMAFAEQASGNIYTSMQVAFVSTYVRHSGQQVRLFLLDNTSLVLNFDFSMPGDLSDDSLVD